jgi:hypothetical protein
MKRNQIRITPHFSLSEFEDRATGFIRIHPLLPLRLEELRSALGLPLIITSSCRTWPEHERIYREIYADRWGREISLTSCHLISGPTPEDLSREPILAERLATSDWKPEGLHRTCCAADIRCPSEITVGDLVKAAQRFFDFVKPYPWGAHVDLRYTELEG